MNKVLFSSYFHIEHRFEYLLESPHRSDSNKYPKQMFLESIKDNILA